MALYCMWSWERLDAGLQFVTGSVAGIFLFAITSKPSVRPTHPLIQCVKCPEFKVDHSPPSGAGSVIHGTLPLFYLFSSCDA